MGASGNKQPKKEKSGKHVKHVPSYQTEITKIVTDDFKKAKWFILSLVKNGNEAIGFISNFNLNSKQNIEFAA